LTPLGDVNDSGNYKVQLSTGITDLAATPNPLPLTEWIFQISALDTTSPAIVARSPSAGATLFNDGSALFSVRMSKVLMVRRLFCATVSAMQYQLRYPILRVCSRQNLCQRSRWLTKKHFRCIFRGNQGPGRQPAGSDHLELRDTCRYRAAVGDLCLSAGRNPCIRGQWPDSRHLFRTGTELQHGKVLP
jgi:hypothetical protein